MVDLANNIWGDFNTAGIPASGTKNPVKSKIREWGTYVETLTNGVVTGSAVFASKAGMDSELGFAALTMGWVVADGTSTNNGIYQKLGASGSGSWTRLADLPYSYVTASDAGAGTANAIVATTNIPVPTADGQALIALNIFETNTGSPVTVSFNGATALTIKTNSGDDVVTGGLVTGSFVIGFKSGTTFRLVSDQASTAIVTAAQDAQAAAETAQGAAEAAAALSAQRFIRVDVVDTAGGAVATDYEAGDTIDGVTLTAGMLVLRATDGGDPADGIYVVPASGAASRSTQFDGYDDLPGSYFSVMGGSTNADSLWRCTSNVGGTLGSTDITIVEFTSGATSSNGSVTPQEYGAVADGVIKNDGAITASDNTLTSASSAFTAADIGKKISVAGAGAAAATLVTTIASINSATSVELTAAASTTVSGEVFCYGTDNDTAIDDAITAAIAADKSLFFADGVYCHGSTIEWNRANNFRVYGGKKVTFLHTGTGIAHSFKGITTPGSGDGYKRNSWFWGDRATVNGNPCGGTTAGVNVDNWHWSYMTVKIRDCTNAFQGSNTGDPGAAAAVESVFDVYVSPAGGETFNVPCAYGMYLSLFAACTFINTTIEVCGDGNVFALLMTDTSNGNLFLAGTVESNIYGGVIIGGNCERNKFISMHNEVNGYRDWQIDGDSNTFDSIAGAASASGSAVSGDFNLFLGCTLQSMVAGGDRNTFINPYFLTAFTDSGTNTTVINDRGGLTTDKAPAPAAQGALSYASGFVDTGSPYKGGIYFRTRAGLVQLEGVVTTGTISGPTVIATLPTGYRPSATVVHTCYNLSTEAVCAITVNSSGQVSTRAGVTTGNILSLDGVSFRPS